MPNRRLFLRGSLAWSGAFFLGCSDSPVPGLGPASPAPGCADPFAGGAFLRSIPFTGEGDPPMETPIGEGLDGRLFTDLSKLAPDCLVTPADAYYVRTRFPDGLASTDGWTISVHGLVASPVDLALADLLPLVEPMGTLVMECSGNAAGGRFGLLSAGTWSGIPFEKVLERVDVHPSATGVLVSGFDVHSKPSEKSIPGASWVFSFDELVDAGAFLATELDGAPLPLDHGFPVRLMMPNWYGCTCAKWVDEIVLVDDTEPATAQMKEFASRTHQDGVPELAKDYRPASIDQAAMPVRIEQWLVGGAVLYRVVGILWGGERPTDRLVIRFGSDEPYVPVDVCPRQETNATWTLWSHAWRPAAPGWYEIRLRIDDPVIVTKRLDTGYYARTVDIDVA